MFTLLYASSHASSAMADTAGKTGQAFPFFIHATLFL